MSQATRPPAPLLSRRTLLTGASAIGGSIVLLARAIPARAQTTKAMPRIGLAGTVEAPAMVAALEKGLLDLGYAHGRNIILQKRFVGTDIERLQTAVAEMLASGVDVLVAGTNPEIRKVKSATSTTPIVMCFSADPVRAGFAASLARPSGNLTGLTTTVAPTMWGKRIELLHVAAPAVARVTLISTLPLNTEDFGAARAAGRARGIDVQSLVLPRADDFEPTLAQLARGGTPGVLLLPDAELFAKRTVVADVAVRHRIPLMVTARDMVEAGALMSYGPNLGAMAYRCAAYIDKILKGARAAELPIEQPTVFELIINAKTAKALRLGLGPALRLQADVIIDP